MKKKLFDKWVKALRSDKFKQGLHELKSKDRQTKEVTNCCWGVLCTIDGLKFKKRRYGNEDNVDRTVRNYDLVVDGVKYLGSGACWDNTGDFLATHFDVPMKIVEEYMQYNDDNVPFENIADRLEHDEDEIVTA